jgi:hypothetical protein
MVLDICVEFEKMIENYEATNNWRKSWMVCYVA